ncbi:cell division protein FtsQ [Nakamurella sp. UYEF19]|uniref:cell division protein FtsQ/DivIB n=1 Tax=Nakamurella sp. UYEF19 TaxID=1756392 RepID=UPI0033984A0A
MTSGQGVQQRPQHRRWPWVLALALVLTLIGGGAFVVYATPVLGLQRVDVTASAGDLSAAVSEAVTSAVDVPDGTPLLRIDLGEVRAKVLAVPQVSAVSVSRHWPNNLMITVTQRVPVAVTSANGAFWLLDASGVPYLRVVKAAVPTALPTVELATPGPLDPSTRAALAVVEQLTGPIRSTLASVSARSPYAVVLQLRDGRSVVWGSPEEGARKMQILAAVLAQPGKTYDISDPAYVTVRP